MVIIDGGMTAAEGLLPLSLKILIQVILSHFMVRMNRPSSRWVQDKTPVRDAYRIAVPSTKAATELILKYPEAFKDFEITKGKMDDVFLAVTGKDLTGDAEK